MERDRFIAPDINAVTELLQEGKVCLTKYDVITLYGIFIGMGSSSPFYGRLQ